MSETTITTYKDIAEEDYSLSVKGKWYTDDDISNLLLAHFDKYKQTQRQAYRERFENNFQRAKFASERLYAFLRRRYKIRIRSIHLKSESIEKFEAIVVLPEKSYLSDAFDVCYWASIATMKHFNTKEFEISFSFMPASRRLNNNALMADGFHYTYKDLKK